MTPEERAFILREADWQQGSVCCQADVAGLLLAPAHPQLVIEEEDWLVVVTQTCDVLQGDLDKEPHLELLRLSQNRPKVGSSIGWTQHPRFIQLERTVPGKKLYGCVHDRVWAPRERFETLKPDEHRKISPADTRMLAKWLAARYLRPAYPDAFNERLRSVQKALRAFWETHRRELRAAYCRLSTMEELAEEDLYEAEFVLVHPYGDLTQAQAGALVDSFEEICSPCQGLEISGKAMADIDFSLVHLSSYTRWDLDFLSFPDPGASPLPPTEADCE